MSRQVQGGGVLKRRRRSQPEAEEEEEQQQEEEERAWVLDRAGDQGKEDEEELCGPGWHET